MKTVRQLALEFWFPLLFAIVWTLLRFYSADHDSSQWQKQILDLVGTFAPAFFSEFSIGAMVSRT